MAATRTNYFGRSNHGYIYGENNVPTTNLTFEFNEFDVWNVASSPEFHKTLAGGTRISNISRPSIDNGKKVKGTTLSLPVDVPDWSMILKKDQKENCNTCNEDKDFDDDLYGDNDELIPPHEYLARARIASFSVHEGVGRTLKGRDLSRVRNEVWKKIGFED